MASSVLMDYFLQSQIRGLQGSIDHAASTASQATLETIHLRETVDRLILACQAMWGLLSKQVGLSESELIEKIREIDLLDGTLDGKLRRPSKCCPSCGRSNGARRARCIYCAKPLEEVAFS